MDFSESLKLVLDVSDFQVESMEDITTLMEITILHIFSCN